ncbi:MAG: two-component system, OmpR family, phosphate regulon response regulator OmpR [Rickettsiaceae bacterium]|jgi:two-component system phosphate regulon response regulator OmpR|nr:two-component system, OmpR family, phosphate regulon response regulator OmpR [Rickettsiaceae bacterium]
MATKSPQILVVDDDTRLRNLLTKYLSDNGFFVLSAKDAPEAREILQKENFDILIIDVMMPNENGIELTKSIRAKSKIPILILTARGDPSERIDGLEAGADDYMPKPFEPKELLLRINNILKRSGNGTSPNQEGNSCKFGDFIFSFADSRLKKNDQYLHITESEAKILAILCQNLGNVVEREKISEKCGNIDARSIDVQITRLRRKIENNPKQPNFLQTVRNRGYVLYS